jgi:hypothetical protein
MDLPFRATIICNHQRKIFFMSFAILALVAVSLTRRPALHSRPTRAPVSLSCQYLTRPRLDVARASSPCASLIANATGVWVEQEDGEDNNEKEPPLTEMWMPLRETGEALDLASRRKKVLNAFQNPLILIPVAILSWTVLPFLAEWRWLLSGVNALDIETFANLVDVVIGGLGITLGVLVGTVITVLRDRLQELRNELYDEQAIVEVCVQQHIKLFRRDKPRLKRSMLLLLAYMVEWRELLQILSRYDIRFENYDAEPWARHFDRQQRRALEMLDVLAEMGDGMLAGPRFGYALFSSLAALEHAETAVIQLNEKRAARRATLESKFPTNVYVTIFGLMVALVLCFVMRAAVVAGGSMLSEPAVRILFSFLVVSFAALLQIMLDLSDPFSAVLPMALRPDICDAATDRVRYALELAEEIDELDERVEDELMGGIRPARTGRYGA